MAPIDSSSSYVVFLIKVVEEYMNMIWIEKKDFLSLKRVL